jgi:DNA-binding transcriptional LysR family regulator
VHYHIYASADYLKRHGTPKSLADLAQHRLITYGEEAPAPISDVNWLSTAGLLAGQKRESILQVNNTFAIMLAVESGLGIAAIPDYMTEGNTRITRVLPAVEGPTFETYFVYPEELRNSKRIAVFRDFLVRKVADWHY